jgi:hypothetical protein
MITIGKIVHVTPVPRIIIPWLARKIGNENELPPPRPPK